MVKMVLHIDGMACGMCESHVNDAIRSAFDVKKVTSSHKKGITEIIAASPLDESALKETVNRTGYAVTEIRTEPYVKKGLLGFGR